MRKYIHEHAGIIKNKIKLLSLELIIILTAFFSSAFLVIFLVREVFVEKEEKFDNEVFNFWSRHVSSTFTEVMQVFTFFGSHYFLVPANLLLIAYSFFVKRDTWFTIKTAAIAISSLLLMFGLKLFFNRPRPLTPLLKEVNGFSFPSGHAFMSFTFFGLLIFMVHARTKNIALKIFLIVFFLCMSVMVGISRIYLRVHYATDVLAGFAMGVIWLTLSLWLLHIIENNKTKLPPVQ
jgi:membrane-associated phospholipid phosphatase